MGYSLSLELTVAGITVEYWQVGVNLGVWITGKLAISPPSFATTQSHANTTPTVFLILLVIINIFGAHGFVEEEFWSSILKLTAIVIFMIIALVLICGGGKGGTSL